ncbi:PREDICTED: DNA excision repair protein ERCC-6-like [Nicrophorus vespilloides]|uniref:DNA repair and recombination protein RAD54-like n=1 Tax=Nicrophorus vespilloides TaxID=110193 RepID=A0ABM1NHR0_NICVS|nr:PREDICTED: DNA excision repair protein ERCC-6-like [Nicrophorus vespilloides]
MDSQDFSNVKVSTVECKRNITELEDLKELDGINVWGQHQEILERQALEELKLLSESKEEGELSDQKEESGEKRKLSDAPILDVKSYIKRQEELQRQRSIRQSSAISQRSKSLADKISKSQAKGKAQKRKGSAECNSSSYKRPRRRSQVCTIVRPEEVAQPDETDDVNKDINKTKQRDDDSDSEYVPSEDDSDYDPETEKPKKKASARRGEKIFDNKLLDDGCLLYYQNRLEKHYKKIKLEEVDDEDDIIIRPGFKITAKIWNCLYSYQQEGLEWLWELHQKSAGGLLGDEMGLGKTVQVIAFLFALNYSFITNPKSNHPLGPTIIVCPTTVLHQWVKHFHDWSPEFRVAVLHKLGSFNGSEAQFIKDMNKHKAIIITTYQGILKNKSLLMEHEWQYIILDEGHKIRNSSAKVSKAVKEFRTPHKIMLTGSPMQNNMQELWCLFDFLNPGMLGTLPLFMDHFANPILQGGYANATKMQEALAISMANTLKNLISPYFLRRAKADVRDDIKLPNKTEQVLFCSMTSEQIDLYKGYLMSEHVSNILGKGSKNWFSENHTRANVLMSITTLRKICNHPDIYSNEIDETLNQNINKAEKDSYGYYKRSGKMVVVAGLLKIWKSQGHRVLLFTQSRSMIVIMELFLTRYKYVYLKMDGSTNVASRQLIIDKFNEDSSIDVFLLTTRVGGLGVNLTGADRVIIYDPDWNPATDTQARERAWRIGQDRDVTIYRLLSAGTIEEKIYQRQVWKQLLSNKILHDQKAQKFFKTSDLHDLFSLQVDFGTNPETANIFKNSRVAVETKTKEKQSIEFSDDKREKMRELAAKIAKNISVPKEIMTVEQVQLESERKKRMLEKQELKTMSAVELLQRNREKSNQPDVQEASNKLDDHETEVSFTKALIISEKSAELYNEARSAPAKIDVAVEKYENLTKIFAKKSKGKKPKKYEDVAPVMIDGQVVQNLVKKEVQSIKVDKSSSQSQDQYVLEKLFSKNGVCSALQHETIVQEGCEVHSTLRIHSETQTRTELALEALRKSREKKRR